MATLRLVRAAERSGVERFIFMSAMGASLQSPTRFFRSKALARRAVESADLRDDGVRAVDRLRAGRSVARRCWSASRLLPVVPIAGAGKARFQPIWAEDVADCIVARARAARHRAAQRSSTSPAPSRCPTTSWCARRCGRSAASARSCTCRCRWSARLAASARARDRPGDLRHGRGGRADGGADGHLARHGGRRGARRHAAADECGTGSGIGQTSDLDLDLRNNKARRIGRALMSDV